jgi:hypothetical protein
MTTDSIRSPGFFKFSLANLIQIVIMLALLLNWWANHESGSASATAVQAVITQQHGDRITKLEESSRQLMSGLTDVQTKINVLVAIAEEQRKKQK